MQSQATQVPSNSSPSQEHLGGGEGLERVVLAVPRVPAGQALRDVTQRLWDQHLLHVLDRDPELRPVSQLVRHTAADA